MMPTFLKVISRSSGVFQGQMVKHWSMDMKLGGWGRFMMPKYLKVIWRSFRGHLGSCKVKWVNIGVWTWNLIGGAKFLIPTVWRSLQCHQRSLKVNWVNIEHCNDSHIQESRQMKTTPKNREPLITGNRLVYHKRLNKPDRYKIPILKMIFCYLLKKTLNLRCFLTILLFRDFFTFWVG